MKNNEEHGNIMKQLNIDTIAIIPDGNTQGGHYLLSIPTGTQIFQSHCTNLPITKYAINWVYALSRNRNSDSGIIFGWRDGNTIDEDWDSDN